MFRPFRNEIVNKMGITLGQHNVSRYALTNGICYGEEGYSDIYDSCTPPTIVEYVRKNWHPIHKQWVMGMKFSTGKFPTQHQ